MALGASPSFPDCPIFFIHHDTGGGGASRTWTRGLRGPPFFHGDSTFPIRGARVGAIASVQLPP